MTMEREFKSEFAAACRACKAAEVFLKLLHDGQRDMTAAVDVLNVRVLNWRAAQKRTDQELPAGLGAPGNAEPQLGAAPAVALEPVDRDLPSWGSAFPGGAP